MIANAFLSLGVIATTACLLHAQCPPRGGTGGGSPFPPPSPPVRVVFPGPGDVVAPAPRAPAPAAPAPGEAAPQALAPRPPAANTPAPPRPPHTCQPLGPVAAPPMQATPSPRQILARFGAPVAYTRERSARARLTWDWDYAKVVQVVAAQDDTVAAPRSHALAFDEAIARVAGDDRRPLLVLRECYLCGSDEESDIGRKLLNEKTTILARWFHCVRVSDAVRAPSHPLHSLFAGERSPHLVLCASDGSRFTTVFGEEPLSSVWQKMRGLLQDAYEGDVHEATSALLQSLSRFDYVDSMEAELGTRLDAAERAAARDGNKVDKLREQLAALALERRAVERHEARVFDLKLRRKSG